MVSPPPHHEVPKSALNSDDLIISNVAVEKTYKTSSHLQPPFQSLPSELGCRVEEHISRILAD